MADYNFHPTLLLRSPVYSYSFYSEKQLSKILKQPFFQRAIYFSSEVFYAELKKCDFEFSKLEKKGVETLKKYFNRMCFRPTPFGICSAFGLVAWGMDAPIIPFNNNNLIPHIQFSYAKNMQYAAELLHVSQNQLVYKLNSCIYKTGNEYRFLKHNNDNTQIEFVIDSFKGDGFLKKMLQYLSYNHTYNEILDFVCANANCTPAEADIYIQWLINNQLIYHNAEANISGEDYLENLVKSNTENQTTTYNNISRVLSKTINIKSIQKLDELPGDEDNLNSNDFYVNLEVKLVNGKLDTAHQQDIVDAITCLDLFTTVQQPAGITDFTKSFSKKFERQAIPLLNALDPEIGVGYGNLAVEEDDVNIAKNIIGTPSVNNNTINWSGAHTLLFNKWKTCAAENVAIKLTEADISGLKNNDESYSPAISVMFRVVDNKVLIETAGGASACSLIGRFTPINTDIELLACDMAATESQYNPGIIFAEIAHICHNKTANIDRRRHIYPYEIPVLVQSTVDTDKQIALNDLWVSVINGQIILQSKKHNKRVIPRLSSAFNYTRNDLAVFRFLCDLQKAYIKTNFGLNLNQFFPGLDYYPRVEYKNTILHLAYWNFKKEAFTDIAKADANSKPALFKTLQQQLGLPHYIALTQNDHQLVFNLNSEPDVLFFLDTIKGLQQFTVKEYLLPSIKKPVVVNENNEPHVNQFIASLYQTKQVYQPIIANITATGANRIFIPGSEWLYIKLYCHAIRSNEILTDCIGYALKKLNKNNLIKQWFFIRYSDPEYHIRLRLKVKPEDQQRLLLILNNSINPHINKGTINNYTINTYEREIERYSPQYMDEFEYCFYTSSNFIFAFFKQQNTAINDTDILEFAIASVTDMMQSLGLNGAALISFSDRIFNSFAAEFSWISDLKYQLDIEYRKQKNVIETVSQNSTAYYAQLKLTKARALFIKSLTTLKKSISDKETWKDKWIYDLVHMHLNRLFTSDARKQEMMIYYFLLKHQRSVQARLTTTKAK